MKRILLIISIFMSFISFAHVDFGAANLPVDINDDTEFSFELETTAVEQSLTIISTVKEPMLIKIIDKSGFIRIHKEIHLDRQIDLSVLKEGSYIIRVYVGNHVKTKIFHKGGDEVDIR